jgi:hypothetical protein
MLFITLKTDKNGNTYKYVTGTENNSSVNLLATNITINEILEVTISTTIRLPLITAIILLLVE